MKQQDAIDPCTGILLAPGFHGEGCPGNGAYPGSECCCDECDYYLECFPEWEMIGNCHVACGGSAQDDTPISLIS